ncbi:MAG TPA: glycosyltransferase family 4 protein [Clostridia bacterium]|nr:glycosyltransferase family 4 protein [Clostridia bacterium]
MKILWIVNMILPEPARHLGIATGPSGSWMEDLSQRIAGAGDCELAVAAVGGDRFRDFTVGKIRYFLLPGNGKTMMFYHRGLVPFWERVQSLFTPDLVQLHGTEYTHGLVYLRMFPQQRAVVSIQGILSAIKDHELDGMPKFSVFRYRTMRENLRFNGMAEQMLLHRKNAVYEKEILRRVRFANTVDFWDETRVREINPAIRCFPMDYNLREPFYRSEKWDRHKMERHTVFTNQGGIPLKGLHMLLRALTLVKSRIPDVKLYVPGMEEDHGRLVIANGYCKYLDRLIRDGGLERNICFLGRLDAAQMAGAMRVCNAAVFPSAMENVSTMMRESMMLGIPTIAAFRGGMADFIQDRQSGFLYDFYEYPVLARRLIEIFEDDGLASSLSAAAAEQAGQAHDPEKNAGKYLGMYREILREVPDQDN